MDCPFVIIDLETRSACDLRERGGHLYAEHPSTRLLTVAWWVDGEYHVWLPGIDRVPPHLVTKHLAGVHVHVGSTPPVIPTDRPWVGHNSFGFDALVWSQQSLPQPPRWIDSQALAQAYGLPGGLDRIGMRLWGEGKYEAGSKELKRASEATGERDCDARNVPVGQAVLVARYNVQDVKLTLDLMEYLDERLVYPRDEQELLAEHRDINDRGTQIDTGLVTALYRLSNEAVEDAIKTIGELTGGRFKTIEDLRKRGEILAWVKELGAADFGDSLRREIVSQWIEGVRAEVREDESTADLTSDEEDDTEATPIDSEKLLLVARVLELRQAAMRITAAKLEAAGNRVDVRGIIRGLFAYWGAHTGRWAGRGVQVQNLPRPKEDVPVWELIALYGRKKMLPVAEVRQLLLECNTRNNEKRMKEGRRPQPPNTLDDAASALLRCIFLPHVGDEVLLAADLAAIEARVLAWLAGEEWLIDVFRLGGDPYISFCERVTGEKIAKKDPRRQVWKVILLGAGYQLGEEKLAVYAAAQGVDLTVAGLTPRMAIEAYRTAHPKIAGEIGGELKDGRVWRRGGFWNDLQAAALVAVGERREVQVGRLLMTPDKGNLLVTLPSGRRLTYQMVRIRQQHKWGKDRPSLCYASPRWVDTWLYGGKWAENVVQACASDFIRHALVLNRRNGIRNVLHVHDEIVASGRREQLPVFMRNMTLVPSWAAGFPLGAEGGVLPRYAKSPPPGDEWKEQTWANGVRVS